MKTFKALTLFLLAAGLAAAQTTYTMTFNGDTGNCGSANACSNYSAVAQQPEPTFYPSSNNNFDTGLQIPLSFHTGSVHPQIPTPQFGTGCQTTPCTFNWKDGGGRSGTITLTSLACRFDQGVPWNYFIVSCNGNDAAGSNVTLTHTVYLIGPLRFGFWNWRDGYGPLDLTPVIPGDAPIIGGPSCTPDE